MLLGGDHFANPAPMQRYPVTWLSVVGKPSTIDLPGDSFMPLLAEAELAVNEDQWLPQDEKFSSFSADDLAPTDPAVIKGGEHIATQAVNSAPDVEDVKAVVGSCARGCFPGNELQRLRR